MKLKPTLAWILYSGSVACGAWVALMQGGTTMAVGAIGGGMAAAATLLGYQANKSPF